jgi:hypothetical protein
MGNQSQLTKGLYADIFTNIVDDDNRTARTLQFAGITPSTDLSERASQLSAEALQTAIKQMAQRSTGADGKPNIGVFKGYLQGILGANVSTQQAREMYRQAMGNEAAAAQSRVNSTNQKMGSIQQRSQGEVFNASVGAALDSTAGTIADIATLNFGNIPQRFRQAGFEEQTDYIPVLDQIVAGQGGDPNKVMVQGDSGWEKLQAGNKEQLEALSKGGKWRLASEPESNGYTLAQAQGGMNPSAFGNTNVNVGGQVSLYVSAAPGINVQAPTSFSLTQNQRQANAAYGTATMNAPPPGDR